MLWYLILSRHINCLLILPGIGQYMKSNFEAYPAPRRAVRLAKRTRVGIDLKYNDVAKVGEITGTEFGFGEMQMQRREVIFRCLRHIHLRSQPPKRLGQIIIHACYNISNMALGQHNWPKERLHRDGRGNMGLWLVIRHLKIFDRKVENAIGLA